MLRRRPPHPQLHADGALPVHSRTLPYTPVHSRTLPYTPVHSRTLPHNPVHSHTILRFPVHSRACPYTFVLSRAVSSSPAQSRTAPNSFPAICHPGGWHSAPIGVSRRPQMRMSKTDVTYDDVARGSRKVCPPVQSRTVPYSPVPNSPEQSRTVPYSALPPGPCSASPAQPCMRSSGAHFDGAPHNAAPVPKDNAA